MRVVVAEDNALLRAGLVKLLASAGLDVVGEAGDSAELIAMARDTKPDVAVVDIRMPPTHTLEGLQAAQVIRAEHGSAIGIILLSQYVETRYAVDLLAGGTAGLGYLLKDRVLDPAELVAAIERVAYGGSALDPVVVEHLLRRRQADNLLATLTSREREVLAGMAEGRSNQSIANSLFVSEKTVEACTGRIFAKLGLEPGPDDHRRVRAVLTYLQAADES